MYKKASVNYEKLLESVESELDDFSERYQQGNSIQKIEWENMNMDWHGLMCSYLDHLISEYSNLTDVQQNKLNNLLTRTKNMKAMIIEKNYEYRDLFDLPLPA